MALFLYFVRRLCLSIAAHLSFLLTFLPGGKVNVHDFKPRVPSGRFKHMKPNLFVLLLSFLKKLRVNFVWSSILDHLIYFVRIYPCAMTPLMMWSWHLLPVMSNTLPASILKTGTIILALTRFFVSFSNFVLIHNTLNVIRFLLVGISLRISLSL